MEYFVSAYREAPKRIVLDLDPTDILIHGNQEGRFFHGYYGNYCYLPLYILCGNHLLAAKLRRSNIDGSAGAKEELARVVEQIRAAWPEVEIVIRGDSGFCREELITWCEENGVKYVIGLAQNERLKKGIEEEQKRAKIEYEQTGKVYEEEYCARGEMENRIKEQQLDLFAVSYDPRNIA